MTMRQRHRLSLLTMLILFGGTLSGLPYAADDGAATPTPEWTAERDQEVERFLLEAKVIESVPIGTGVTNPKRLTLEMDGRQMTAAYKDINEELMGRTAFDQGIPEYNFTDKFVYDRAAYLLDRELGIYMVPVTVIREVEGKAGAVTEWIANAIQEGERQEKGLDSDPRSIRMKQADVKRIFDTLTMNTDPNLGNTLYTLDDWRMYLIDFSRAFRLGKKLNKTFEVNMITLPLSLYDKLQALEEARLMEVMEGLLSKAQVKALIKRRDKMILKIDADREKYGDPIILRGETPE